MNLDTKFERWHWGDLWRLLGIQIEKKVKFILKLYFKSLEKFSQIKNNEIKILSSKSFKNSLKFTFFNEFFKISMNSRAKFCSKKKLLVTSVPHNIHMFHTWLNIKQENHAALTARTRCFRMICATDSENVSFLLQKFYFWVDDVSFFRPNSLNFRVHFWTGILMKFWWEEMGLLKKNWNERWRGKK